MEEIYEEDLARRLLSLESSKLLIAIEQKKKQINDEDEIGYYDIIINDIMFFLDNKDKQFSFSVLLSHKKTCLEYYKLFTLDMITCLIIGTVDNVVLLLPDNPSKFLKIN